MTQFYRLLAVLLSVTTLVCCEESYTEPFNKREIMPPPGAGYRGKICPVIRNYAPFAITGRLQLKSRERATFRLSRNESKKICITGELYGRNTISFVLTNYLTLPLFSCYTRTNQSIDVYARKQNDTWVYKATCRK